MVSGDLIFLSLPFKPADHALLPGAPPSRLCSSLWPPTLGLELRKHLSPCYGPRLPGWKPRRCDHSSLTLLPASFLLPPVSPPTVASSHSSSSHPRALCPNQRFSTEQMLEDGNQVCWIWPLPPPASEAPPCYSVLESL